MNVLLVQDGRRFAMALSANGFKQVNVINRDTNQRVPITSGAMVGSIDTLYNCIQRCGSGSGSLIIKKE